MESVESQAKLNTIDDYLKNNDRAIGADSAKWQRQQDAIRKCRVENAHSFRRSLKMKADFKEEKNSMRAFALSPCETEEDRNEKVEYFYLMRCCRLWRAQEWEKKANQDYSYDHEEESI